MTFLAKLILVIVGLASVVFGAHGLVVYFTPVESLFDKYPSDLFLKIQMPSAFWSSVEWMTYRGLDSWVIPTVFVAIGIVLWVLAGRISSLKKAAA